MNLKRAAQRKLRKSGGFTLVEMLIVVAIIAILVVVSIPLVGNSLDKARTAADDANERAAKAAALTEYMLSETTPVADASGTTVTYYYNAATGKVARDKDGITTGYNQKDQKTAPDNADKGKGCVKVTITIASGETATVWESITT